MQKVNNFTVMESIYGKVIINRHSTSQADYLIKSGVPHTEPELKTIFAILESMPGQLIAVDAGANAGLIALPIAQMLKPRGGTVIAFEPQRMIHNALCGSVALNDLNNMHVRRQAVGAESGMVRIPLPDYGVAQDFGQLTLLGDFSQLAHELVEVVTIDSLELPRLDFLKIDVEGMEIDVLKGAANTIKKYLPWCWIEHWKIGMDTIAEQFDGLPYKFEQIDQLNMLCAPEARLDAMKRKLAETAAS